MAKAAAPIQKIPEEIRQAFSTRIDGWIPGLKKDSLEKISAYYIELLRFNTAVNLISTATVSKADSLHFADSILAARMIKQRLGSENKLHDLGSGNGLPGLIFGMLFPEIEVILLDRDRRKIEFLKHVIATTKAANIKAEPGTIEELGAGAIKHVVSRGLAPLPKALLMLRKCVAKGGLVFHMKGDGWATELASVPTQLFSVWTPSLVGQYRIPESSIDAGVVLTEKVGN